MSKLISRKKRLSQVLALGLAAGLLTGCAGSGTDAPAAAPITIDDSGKLSEKTTVTVAIPSKLAIFLPVLLEDTYGEFEARNIDLVVETVPATDSLPLLETGQLDAVVGSPTVGVANAVAAGADFRIALPGAHARPDTKSGWWVSNEALGGKEFKPEDLKGKIVAASNGEATSASAALGPLLEEAGLTLKDVEFSTIASADTVIALENGSIFAGIIVEPFHVPLEESGAATQIAATAYPGYANSFVLYGKSLLTENPEVGKAFATAYQATISNHLQGDVTADPKRGPIVADALGITVEDLKNQPPPEFPVELAFPDNYIAPFEDAWQEIGGLLSYTDDLTNDQLIDTTFLEWANQHSE
jgi:NitT/TauT family transport system substrate-binding protein